MRKKWIPAGIALAAAMLFNTLAVQAQSTPQAGTTYYISSLNGDNSNRGTSQNAAWETLDKVQELQLQPGDRILLERGSVFANGYLHLYNQKGSEGNPIVIDAYGDEQKAAPLIETNGQGLWYQNFVLPLANANHRAKGYVSSSILLYDTEYIEIQNIALTNDELAVDSVYNDRDAMNRTGVAAVAKNGGTLNHIYLKNLDISNVRGNVYDKHMNNGGIYFTAFQPENEEQTGIPRYDDVLIENCKVENVSRWGIAVGYTAYQGQFKDNALIDDAAIQKYGSTNVVIKNNYVKDVGGDAITPMYCYQPVVEYNVSDGVARQINPNDYSATDFGRVAAAIWPWKCKNALFQYNEAFDTCENPDGQAWDADSADGTLYQYNYSHNNSGGAVMFCLQQAINSTFRYNISQNDLGGIINPVQNPNAHIYNNVFYVKEGVPFIRSGMSGGNMTVENNIIYYSGEEPRTEDWYLETSQDKAKYDNNLYYNYANTPANDANPVVVQKGTPVFVDPGKAPSTPNSVVNDRSAFDGYKLAENSPAINAGKVITDENGYAVEKDFFGNPVQGMQPDIGAYETDTPESVTLDIYSSVYKVDKASAQISEIPKDTTVEAFQKNVTYSSGLTFTVKRADAVLQPTDVLQKGDQLTLTNPADPAQTVTYTLQVKAEYVEYDRASWTAKAGSEQPDRLIANAFDNNDQTLWHTSFDSCPQEDIWVEIDMQTVQNLDVLRYVPRVVNGTNGIFTQYRVSVKANEGDPWQEVSSGTWENNTEHKLAVFNSTVAARYVKLEGLQTVSQEPGKIFGSAAEIYLGYEVK